MRVLVMKFRSRDERGATAILVAAMAVALVVLASFTVDFGMAYASKRQLQTATDAASLAAASSFAGLSPDLNCAGLLAYVDATGQSAKQTALDVADDILAENRPGAERVNQSTAEGSVSEDVFSCAADNSALMVRIAAEADTDTALGGVAGVGVIRTHREAEATLDSPDSGVGVRPYMICSTQLPPSWPDTTPRKITFPKKTGETGPPDDKTPGPKDKDPGPPEPDEDELAGCPYAGGNWFTVDCPHDGNGDNGDLAENTLNGCQTPITVRQPQDPTSPVTLRDSLLPACEPVDDWDEDCLTSNPGDPNGDKVREAWDALIGESIVLPVFCGEPCDDDDTEDVTEAGWEDDGNNTAYPVYRLAGVKVCGWHWSSKHSAPYDDLIDTEPGDPCSGADASDGDANENYLLVAYKNVEISGTVKPTTCKLGDLACNLRRVLLTR